LEFVMAFTQRPFQGATFFSDIRSAMSANRGMFAGQDGGFLYTVMDATFYRMEIYVRPAALTFTDGAESRQAVEPDVRVICTGQFMAGNLLDYELVGPDLEQRFEGQIIISHSPQRFESEKQAWAHIGQWDGRSHVAFQVGYGEPGDVNPRFNHAMGRLYPMIENGVPYGISDVPGSPGSSLQKFHPGTEHYILNEPDKKGKVVCGIHRDSQSVFVLVQRDGATGGMGFDDVIALLLDMGVKDAVACDGSDSVALIVEGTTEVTPGLHKNNGNTTGLMFRLQSLRLANNAMMTVNPSGNDTRFPLFTHLYRTEGVISLTNSGAEIALTQLGYTSATIGVSAQLTANPGSANPLVPAGAVLTAVEGELRLRYLASVNAGLEISITRLLREGPLAPGGWASAGDSLDPAVPANTRIEGPTGVLSITDSGAVLEITSLGSMPATSSQPARNPEQTAALLGVTLPLTLTSNSASANLRTTAGFTGSNVTAELHILFWDTPNALLVGVLRINTGRSLVPFAINWPLTQSPYSETGTAALLGVALPLTLISLGGAFNYQDLNQPVSFDIRDATNASVGNAQLQKGAQGPQERLTGLLNIDTFPGLVSFNVQWPLESALRTQAETAALLGIPLPLRLTAAGSNLTANTPFQAVAPPAGVNVSANLRIESARDNDGAMLGTLQINGQQRLDLDVLWPLTS
jgi:hypothetical protein